MTTTEVIDLVGLGEEFLRNPFPFYAELRARGPVHRVRIPGGFEAWLVVGYEAGRAALADPRLSKRLDAAAPSVPVITSAAGTHMLNSDPPDHSRLRKLVTMAFTPRRIELLEPRVQAIADELLDDMLARPDGRADLVESLSFPLPITVICELVGVPTLDRATFRGWVSDQITHPDVETRRAATVAISDYITELIEDKRRDPGEDLISGLIRTADEDGDRLSADELRGTVWLLLVAGHETTVNLISNGVVALLAHPDQLAALRGDMSLLGNAVEEMLRYDGPLEIPTFRFTTEPIDIGGVTVPGGGEVVVVSLADAGRDPAKFPEPDRFDIRRNAHGHLGFGHGMHFCLGATLARMEAKVAIGSLLERCPDLALDVHPAAIDWRRAMPVRGPRSLPVRWA
ncbi:cytochrome P450 [Kutzneria sp. NPDC052558]|uniref:cytochrome P450 n=1 Tax=Kutzneria sp. NPDC052558 TaxID=3364121 RepID=UPI0037CC33FA